MKLQNYLQDGADWQSRAVLACLQGQGNIEKSWNKNFNKYDAEIKVARWENDREDGYIVYILTKDYSRQLNIAFFEHRNSDNICAVKWEQRSTNALTIDTAEFGDVYKTKYDVSHTVSYGEFLKMAKWIFAELENFYINHEPL